MEELAAELAPLETTVSSDSRGAGVTGRHLLTDKRAGKLREAVASFARNLVGKNAGQRRRRLSGALAGRV